jgi:hypothetical protein
MSFDPTKPATNSPTLPAELRSQFHGLNDLIDESIPGSDKGVATLDGAGRLVEPADWTTLDNKPVAVPDGTYTMGFGTAHGKTGIPTWRNPALAVLPSVPTQPVGPGGCH